MLENLDIVLGEERKECGLLAHNRPLNFAALLKT